MASIDSPHAFAPHRSVELNVKPARNEAANLVRVARPGGVIHLIPEDYDMIHAWFRRRRITEPCPADVPAETHFGIAVISLRSEASSCAIQSERTRSTRRP